MPDLSPPGSRNPASKLYAASRAAYEQKVERRATHDSRAYTSVNSLRTLYKGGVSADPTQT